MSDKRKWKACWQKRKICKPYFLIGRPPVSNPFFQFLLLNCIKLHPLNQLVRASYSLAQKMLRWPLLKFQWIWSGQKRTYAQRFFQYKSSRIEEGISELPDDLLLNILVHLPAKVAVSTVILSKRWRCFWRMQPELIMYLKTQAKLQNLKSKLLLRVEKVCTLLLYVQFSNVHFSCCYICSLQVVL